MNDNFPKFQWSSFVNGKDEQYVVRGNDWEAFILDIDKVKTVIKPKVTAETASPVYTSKGNPDYYDLPDVPECGIHHVPMVRRKGPRGEFWGCATYATTKCNWKPLGY